MGLINIIKQFYCSHESSCSSVKDNTNWVIGEFCAKCGKFWLRSNIPTYEERMQEKIKKCQ